MVLGLSEDIIGKKLARFFRENSTLYLYFSFVILAFLSILLTYAAYPTRLPWALGFLPILIAYFIIKKMRKIRRPLKFNHPRRYFVNWLKSNLHQLLFSAFFTCFLMVMFATYEEHVVPAFIIGSVALVSFLIARDTRARTKVTLDMNCIIDLEEGNTTAPYIQKMIQMHKDHQINLRVVAISASERKPDGTYASNFNEFKERLATLGLEDVEILRPIAYTDIAFFDYCVLGGGKLSELEKKIQEILFPKIEMEYKEFCMKRNLNLRNKEMWRQWVNAKCDVLSLWSHIRNGGGIFVTKDKNFHKKTKKSRLVALGAGEILTPAKAVNRIMHA
jgi:hypothetical protein